MGSGLDFASKQPMEPGQVISSPLCKRATKIPVNSNILETLPLQCHSGGHQDMVKYAIRDFLFSISCYQSLKVRQVSSCPR